VRSEASIQRAVVRYARDLGGIAIKLTTAGRYGTAGWPDYLFLMPDRSPFAIEFKAEGGELTALQTQRIAEMARHIKVFVVDNVEDGKGIIARGRR
jgi:hypothetical protein